MPHRCTTLRAALAIAASTVRTAACGMSALSLGPPRLRRPRRAAAWDSQISDVPGARPPKLARVEAVLFAAGEPLSTRRIADAANLADGAEARVLVQELKALYDADASA